MVSPEWLATRDLAAYEREWRRRLGAPDPLSGAWIAIEGREVVGIVSACALADDRAAGAGSAAMPTASIRSMHVRPDRLGSGIGRRLWCAACSCLGERGFVRARFDVIEANARARRFYDAAGARLAGRAPAGVEGVPIMTYEIDVEPPGERA